jgi:hypothetical protein
MAWGLRLGVKFLNLRIKDEGLRFWGPGFGA